MNFDQWYLRENYPTGTEGYTRATWKACKEEILSVIEARSEKCCGTRGIELVRIAQVIRTVV